MTAKEKKEELIYRFSTPIKVFDYLEGWIIHLDSSKAKGHALVAVDEIINSTPLEPNFADWDDCGWEHRYYHDAQKTHALHFWQEVKKEIEKL